MLPDEESWYSETGTGHVPVPASAPMLVEESSGTAHSHYVQGPCLQNRKRSRNTAHMRLVTEQKGSSSKFTDKPPKFELSMHILH